MRHAVSTSRFMASMRDAASVSSTEAFQFVRRSQRGGMIWTENAPLCLQNLLEELPRFLGSSLGFECIGQIVGRIQSTQILRAQRCGV